MLREIVLKDAAHSFEKILQNNSCITTYRPSDNHPSKTRHVEQAGINS